MNIDCLVLFALCFEGMTIAKRISFPRKHSALQKFFFFLPLYAFEWPRNNFSVLYQYKIKQPSGENWLSSKFSKQTLWGMYDMVTISFMEILRVIGLNIKGFLKQEKDCKEFFWERGHFCICLKMKSTAMVLK